MLEVQEPWYGGTEGGKDCPGRPRRKSRALEAVRVVEVACDDLRVCLVEHDSFLAKAEKGWLEYITKERIVQPIVDAANPFVLLDRAERQLLPAGFGQLLCGGLLVLAVG